MSNYEVIYSPSFFINVKLPGIGEWLMEKVAVFETVV